MKETRKENLKKYAEWHKVNRNRLAEILKKGYADSGSWEAFAEQVISDGVVLCPEPVEQQEPEPTPTEMVRKLLDAGWEIEHPSSHYDPSFLSKADDTSIDCPLTKEGIENAYRKAFPKPKLVRHEVNVWWRRDTSTIMIYPPVYHPDDWIKGTAIFMVPEEE